MRTPFPAGPFPVLSTARANTWSGANGADGVGVKDMATKV